MLPVSSLLKTVGMLVILSASSSFHSAARPDNQTRSLRFLRGKHEYVVLLKFSKNPSYRKINVFPFPKMGSETCRENATEYHYFLQRNSWMFHLKTFYIFA